MLLMPLLVRGQDIAGGTGGLQSALDQVYQQMLPLCAKLIGVGRGIAGIGASCFIAWRVWGHIARAEPVDFFPLLRPFALGMAILLFPQGIALLNGILQPVTSATASMVRQSNQSISLLIQQKQEALSSSGELEADSAAASQGSLTAALGGLVTQSSLDLKAAVSQWMSDVLQLLYEAAALCIDLIRTFYLIVLAILGPLVLGLSVFDGFRSSLSSWLARYIHVSLWLPVANLFGAIIGTVEQQMLTLDLNQIHQGGSSFFSATDTAYMIFLILGIVGYFMVPSVCSYIVHSAGNQVLGSRLGGLVAGGAAWLGSHGSPSGSQTSHQTHSTETPGSSAQYPGYSYEKIAGKTA